MSQRNRLLLFVLLAVLVALALPASGCGGGDTGPATTAPGAVEPGETSPGSTATTPRQEGETRVFTAAELATFDGKDGRPAYVAVDGVVYDVTGQPNWPGGEHAPCSLETAAGGDLSEVLKKAPASMRGYVEAMPVAGTMEE